MVELTTDPKESKRPLIAISIFFIVILVIVGYLLLHGSDISLPNFSQRDDNHVVEQLHINIFPSTIYENTSFEVIVTSQSAPIEHALIVFDTISYFTDDKGIVNLTAPEVEKTSEYRIIASADEYMTAFTTITVIDNPVPGYGWLYGVIVDTLNHPVVDARIETQRLGGEIQFTMSDATGKYLISVPEGTYMITVSKSGYKTSIESNIIIQNKTAYEKNFILEK